MVAMDHSSRKASPTPEDARFARIRGRMRWHLLLRGRDRRALRAAAKHAVSQTRSGRGVRVVVDVDPVSTL